MREDRTRDRDASEARFQTLLTKMQEPSKRTTAPEVVQAVQSLLGFTLKRLEMEPEVTKKQQTLLLDFWRRRSGPLGRAVARTVQSRTDAGTIRLRCCRKMLSRNTLRRDVSVAAAPVSRTNAGSELPT